MLALLSDKLGVYHNDNDHFPAELSDLVRPTDSRPRGYLPEGAVPVDPWGRDFRYMADSKGASFQLWSVGADGIDEEGKGDDISLN